MVGPQQQHRYPPQAGHMMQQQKGQMGPGGAMPPGGMIGVNGSQTMPRVPASAGFGTRPPMQGRCRVDSMPGRCVVYSGTYEYGAW